MKRALSTLLLVGAALLWVSAANAQVVVTIQDPLNQGYQINFPFNYTWWSSITEAVVTQGEMQTGGWLGGPGKIQSIAWNCVATQTYTNGIFYIYMANSSETSLVSGAQKPDVDFTLVWSGPAPQFLATGWYQIPLPVPFDYTGDGLYIKTVKDGTAWSGSPYFSNSVVSPYRFRYVYNDVPAANLGTLDVSSSRPDMQFEICNGPATETAVNTPEFVNIPSDIDVAFFLARPEGEFVATTTVRLFDLEGNLVLEMPAVMNPIGEGGTYADGIVSIPTGAVPPGFYLIKVTINSMDQCGNMSDIVTEKSILVLGAGTQPCIVYPGDVTNDGVCNYADIKGLTQYIHNANTQTAWLLGPARYRANGDKDPLTYIQWEAQAGAPWTTPNGCYMDTDGNGTVNNFDFLAIKMNWMRTKGGDKKVQSQDAAMGFTLDQNFPNPFNPETKIRFTAPENAAVRLRIYNSAGELVRTLVNNGNTPAGTHTVSFSGEQLSSGVYVAVISMIGNESGLSYSKSMKMTLAK